MMILQYTRCLCKLLDIGATKPKCSRSSTVVNVDFDGMGASCVRRCRDQAGLRRRELFSSRREVCAVIVVLHVENKYYAGERQKPASKVCHVCAISVVCASSFSNRSSSWSLVRSPTCPHRYRVRRKTARKDVSLGVARKRYKRLEADMFRSRVELADTLSEVEKDHQKHENEMKRAEERAKELEVALRAADEVVI